MSANTPVTIKSSAKPEDRRTVILDAALELFTRQGYDATSIDQIRIASGFKSKASLYTHFNSKEEVSSALIAKILRKIHQVVMKAEQSADSNPLARFTSVFRAYIEWGLTHREEFVFRIIRAQELRMLNNKYDFEDDPSLYETSLHLRFINILELLREQQYPVRDIQNAALFHMTIGAICRSVIDRSSFGDISLAELVEQIFQVCVGIVFTRTPDKLS